MKSASEYLLGLQDGKSGGFRFTAGSPATLMATGYAVLGLEFEGSLARMSAQERSRIATFLLSALDPGGNFRDPLFRQEDILSRAHSPAYFEEETTAFCMQAMDALGEKVPPSDVPKGWAGARELTGYLESLPWNDPWLASNRVMFALSRLCYEAEKNGRREQLSLVDAALEWLDGRQDRKNGLWMGSGEGVPASNAMAATVHFLFFYSYRGRTIRFAEQLVDSCLRLQAVHGLFSRTAVGNTCFDYDAIQILDVLRGRTEHRKKDVSAALLRAASALRTLQNEDGGFADAKLRIPLRGRAPLFLAQKMVSERFTNCWKHLSCLSAESNAYSTWLRRATLVLTGDGQPEGGSFRRLPFLGYRRS